MTDAIRIDEPAAGATVVLGADVRVAGGADSILVGAPGHQTEYFPTAVKVSVVGGPEQLATALGARWES
jgi:hypothetical protein